MVDSQPPSIVRVTAIVPASSKDSAVARFREIAQRHADTTHAKVLCVIPVCIEGMTADQTVISSVFRVSGSNSHQFSSEITEKLSHEAGTFNGQFHDSIIMEAPPAADDDDIDVTKTES